MATKEEPTIDVKLFVDNEKKKVLFAESDKEFVDVLFSFLTMPGTIVRLLGKQSQMGCLDEVYKSVEDLDPDYFATKACKGMLLAPLNAASGHCSGLKINVDDTKKRAVYVCKDTYCGYCAFSSVPDAVCKCGKVMQYVGDRPDYNGKTADTDSNGVFVKGRLKFITTDDLQVAPASTSLLLSLFEKFGVQDPADIEQRILQLSSEKITRLLKRSLTSRQPLTGLYSADDASLDVQPQNPYPGQVNATEHNLDGMKIRVLQMKNNSSLLYAEVGDDFVDDLFGLLSVPIGSMAPFFGSSASQILLADELASKELKINSCFKCFKTGGFANVDRCREETFVMVITNVNTPTVRIQKHVELCELDPKSPEGGTSHSDAYVKQGPQRFMVTNDLHVRPLSLASSLQVMSEAKIRTKELVEKELTLTKLQVMELLRAALVTRNALSSVLLPPKKKRNLHRINSGLY
ncbi:hypothetical protein ACP70R_011040 [Stipagrostis hirtigluma subsp. patula]